MSTKYTAVANPELEDLRVGDLVTLTAEGEAGSIVREIKQLGASLGITLVGMLDIGIKSFGANGLTVTRIERPEVELPTVPGDYIVTSPTGYRSVVTLNDDRDIVNPDGTIDDRAPRWVGESVSIVRVVPAPAALADRLDIDKVSARMKSLFHGDRHWSEDAADFIAAIDNGELDK